MARFSPSDREGHGAGRPWHRQAVEAADLLATPACVFDAAGLVIHLNAAWRALRAPPAGRLRWSHLVDDDHCERAGAHFLKALAQRLSTTFECLLAGRDAPRWHLVSLHPCGDGGGLCTATDIHDLKAREAEARSRARIQEEMLDISPDCIKLIAPDGTLLSVNRSGRLALGIAQDSPLGMPWLPLLPDSVHDAGRQALEVAVGGQPSRFSGRSVIPGQAAQAWDNVLTPVLDAAGRTTAVLCISREVTAEQNALDSLKESQERLAIAARVAGFGLWDYDICQDRLECDAAWYRIMGRDRHTPVVSMAHFRPFIHPDDVETATEVARTAAELVAAQEDYCIEFRIVRPDGEVRWIRSLAFVHHEDGVPTRATGFVVDITDALHGELALRDANRTLEMEKDWLARVALLDPLTGIANRRHLDNELPRLCRRASESGEALCVGMIDVDHFKRFNDRYGHPEGDAALRRIATALQSVVRQGDVVARYGGEEFAFVLGTDSDPAPMLERFAAAVAGLEIPHADSPTGWLTISTGAVVARPPDLTMETLVRMADEALYAAKQAGRNRVVVRTPDG